MLSNEEKIEYFQKLLDVDDNYFKEELYTYYFLLEQGTFEFLNQCNSYDDIDEKTNYLISKIAMHEHEDCISNIIECY